jgi:hypothetical protein
MGEVGEGVINASTSFSPWKGEIKRDSWGCMASIANIFTGRVFLAESSGG